MPDVQPWARVVGDVNVRVRRGAWYRVSRLMQEWVLLDVNDRSVSVPRINVEIVTTRPEHWSVVERPYDAVDLPIKWGLRYAVCPRCSRRAQIDGHPMEMQCLGCKGLFQVRLP
ncbi:MAG TPA: hypothetical protein VM716_09665 [Gemmatimonadales bacterium]|nr:hypothetical protein [Gemmatimonadales bacterium]